MGDFVDLDDTEADAELDEATDESTSTEGGDSQNMANEAGEDTGDEEAEDDDGGDGEADPLEALRRMLPPKPKFLYYTPKYHVDLFERDRLRRSQMADAAKKKGKKETPS